MVEKALESVIGWISDMLNGFVVTWMGNISFNSKMVTIYLPGFTWYGNFTIYLGWAALFFCLVIAAIQMMAVPITGQERPNLIQISVRAFVAGAMILSVKEITNTFLNIVDHLYSWMCLTSVPRLDVEGLVDGAVSSGASELGNYIAIGANAVFFTIFGIIIMVAMIKAIIAVLTRAVLLIVGFYTGPFCVAFFANPSTSVIASMWFKTIIGQAVLLLLSAWCLRVAVTSLSDNTSALSIANEYTRANGADVWGGDTGGNWMTAFMIGKFLYVWFLCKVVVKLEDFVKSIGFNPYPTGSSIRAGLGSIVGVAMMASRAFSGGARGAGRAGSAASSSKAASGEGSTPIRSAPNEAASEGSGMAGGKAGKDRQKAVSGSASSSSSALAGSQSRGFSMQGSQRQTQKQYARAAKEGASINTPEDARTAANLAWSKGKGVKGSTMNKAFGDMGTAKFVDDYEYKMDKNNFVQGPMRVRRGNSNQWDNKEMVMDFNADWGRKASETEFVGDQGQYMSADTSSFMGVSSDGSIRGYELKETGETVQGRSAMQTVNMESEPGGSVSGETFNQANSYFSRGKVQESPVRMTESAPLKAVTRDTVDGKKFTHYQGEFSTDRNPHFEGAYFPKGYKESVTNLDGKHTQDVDPNTYTVNGMPAHLDMGGRVRLRNGGDVIPLKEDQINRGRRK